MRRSGAFDHAAEVLTDALMAQADAEDRGAFMKLLDRFEGDPPIVRRSRSGRDDDSIGFFPLHFGCRDGVVPVDLHIGAEFSQVLY